MFSSRNLKIQIPATLQYSERKTQYNRQQSQLIHPN